VCERESFGAYMYREQFSTSLNNSNTSNRYCLWSIRRNQNRRRRRRRRGAFDRALLSSSSNDRDQRFGIVMTTTTTTTVARTRMISLTELVGKCVRASYEGCVEIRKVRHENDNGTGDVREKSKGDARSALTEADVNAQMAIVKSLRKYYGPELAIVGEEDDDGDNNVTSGDCSTSDDEDEEEDDDTFMKFVRNKCGGGDNDMIALEDVCIFVDPVDGTREFVEGRIENCQCLVGISVNGRSVAGAIGIPFPKGLNGFEIDREDAKASAIIFGLCGVGGVSDDPESDKGVVGVFNEHLMHEKFFLNEVVESNAFTITTGDSSSALLKAAVDATASSLSKSSSPSNLKDINRPLVGGAGSKIVNVAFGKADVALMHPTCLWDSCAPEAVLKAAGGFVTDFFGAPLCHSKNARTLENRLGIIASMPRKNTPTRKEMCANMRACEDLQILFAKEAGFENSNNTELSKTLDSQAYDIARALDGSPLTVEYLSNEILSRKKSDDYDEHTKLIQYSVSEQTAVRGLMSDAVRIDLTWKAAADTESSHDVSLPNSLFYKRVDMQNLAHVRLKKTTAPMKISRDVRSFYVESAFLSSSAARALHAAGVGIPRCYASAFQLNERSSVDSKFALLLQDFSPEQGWFQEKSLNLEQARSAVIALARMHAFFLPDAKFLKDSKNALVELEKSVWLSGAYWQPSMQTMDEQVANLAKRYDTYLISFEKDIEDFITKRYPNCDVKTIGERLQKVAVDVGEEAFPFAASDDDVSLSKITSNERLKKQRTIVHGDPKAGNIFLKQKQGGDGTKYECSLIDFQWTGFGLPGTDLGHFLAASITEDALFDDGKSLIDLYYENFCKYATEFGCGSNIERDILTKEELERQVDISILDTTRCIFAYQWHRARACPEMLEKNKESIGRNSYNKNKFNAMWIIRRCDELLKKI
jgi:3'-phosphoadenosine 5'-phosphosulfate (PAPS) 3'-phosphatase/thiamine kinase-like enzyme